MPESKVAEQVGPQGMSPPVTDPVPVPERLTPSVYTRVNTAVTDRAALILTAQEPVPVHAPVQWSYLEPAAGVAVSVTAVPSSYRAEHVVPQSMPFPPTLPEPLPDRATSSV